MIIQVLKHCRIEITKNGGYFENKSVLVASSFLTGTAVISALLTVLGLIGQLRSLPLTFVLLLGAVGLMLGRKSLHDFIYASFDALRVVRAMPPWLLFIGGSTALLALGCGVGSWVLPPIGDAAAFYMAYPKIIAATGLLEPMHGPLYAFSVIGLPIELHYAALMVLADEHAAKFFMFPIAISAGVMLVGIVRLCGGGIAAITITWAMLFSSYTFHHFIYDGKVDLIAAAFGLAAVYWLLRGTGSSVSILACGVAGWFAGLATTAKFSYLVALTVSLSALLAWRLVVSRPQETKLAEASFNLARVSGVMVIAAVVAWLPQLLKNWVLFDAPLAPFLGGAGEGNLLNQVWFSPDDTRKILLTYPLALVFGRYPMQGGGLSFLFLSFLPFLIWMTRPRSWRKSMTLAVTVAAFAGVASWMVLRPSVLAPRYILASLLLFVPILAIVAEDVLTRAPVSRLLRTTTTIKVLLAIAASFWPLLPIPGAFFLQANHKNNECLFAIQECHAFRKLAHIGQPSERIFIGSYYPYWLKTAQLQCRDSLQEHLTMPDRERLVSWLKIQGFRYLIIDRNQQKKLMSDLDFLSTSKDLGINLLYEDKVISLFRIESDMKPSVECVEVAPGRWVLNKI